MRYMTAETAEAASAALAGEPGLARVLAGGTDLLVQLKAGMIRPDLVVDIKKIPGIREITGENGGFRIGAAVANAELKEHPEVRARWPGVPVVLLSAQAPNAGGAAVAFFDFFKRKRHAAPAHSPVQAAKRRSKT